MPAACTSTSPSSKTATSSRRASPTTSRSSTTRSSARSNERREASGQTRHAAEDRFSPPEGGDYQRAQRRKDFLRSLRRRSVPDARSVALLEVRIQIRLLRLVAAAVHHAADRLAH